MNWLTPSENTQHAVDTGLNKCKKAIIQCDLNGNEVAQYCSAAKASRETHISGSSIRKCLKHLNKTAGGFTWKYQTDF